MHSKAELVLVCMDHYLIYLMNYTPKCQKCPKIAKKNDLIKPHISDEYTVNSTKNFILKSQDFDIREGDFCSVFHI